MKCSMTILFFMTVWKWKGKQLMVSYVNTEMCFFMYWLFVGGGGILWVNCLRVLTEMCFWCAAPQSFAWGGKCSSRWPCWTAVSSPPWWGQRSDPPGPASGVTSLPVHSRAWQSTIHASGMKTVENI